MSYFLIAAIVSAVAIVAAFVLGAVRRRRRLTLMVASARSLDALGLNLGVARWPAETDDAYRGRITRWMRG